MNTLYAIKRKEDQAFLNIRKFGSDNEPIYNSYKEKKFWITNNKHKAIAQEMLLKGKHIIVEIKEITY